MTDTVNSNVTVEPDTNSLFSQLKRTLLRQEVLLVVFIIFFGLILANQNERFLSSRNVERELVLLFEVALIAIPMTFIIITGGIDLSVGSIFGLSAVVLGFAWQDWGFSMWGALAAALLAGTACGFFNGFFIVQFRIPPLIMTLATLALFRGIALGISQGRSARGFPDWYFEIGRGDLMGLPNQVWILGFMLFLFGIVLTFTPFGRSLYAIGNNEVASRFAGLPVRKNKLLIYMFSGFMCGLAAVVFVSRVSTTRSAMGVGMELDVIATVVLGGTSIFGGSGTLSGTILGLLLIRILTSGLLLSGFKGDATIIMIGTILIASILINDIIQRRLMKS